MEDVDVEIEAPRDGREMYGSGSREAARFVVPESLMLSEEQARWLRHAAVDQQTSKGAILRGALESYRRLHPTWVPDM
jgi:hypothetical protein